jgi:hypothetical protein
LYAARQTMISAARARTPTVTRVVMKPSTARLPECIRQASANCG